MAKEEKKIKKRVIPADRTQVNFNLKSEILAKVEVLASEPGTNKSDIYNAAITEYITRYETKNGKIKVPAKSRK